MHLSEQEPHSEQHSVTQPELQSLAAVMPAAKPEPPDPPPDILYESFPLNEFDQQTFDYSYIIKDVLLPEQAMMIGGAPKSMKTTVAADAGISIATGTAFLGKFQVLTKLPVAMFSREAGKRKLQDTCRRICKHKLVHIPNVSEFRISTALPKIEDPRHHKALAYFLKTHGTKVLILDNIYLSMSGDDWSNAAKVGNKLQTTLDICLEFGTTLIYTCHTRKTIADPNKPAEIQDATGAGFGEFAGQWVMLSRRSEYKKDGVHELHLNSGTREGDCGLWGLEIREGMKTDPAGQMYLPFILSSADAKASDMEKHEAARKAKAAEKIINALENAPDHTLTKTQIGQRAKVYKQTLTDTLADIEKAGVVGKTIEMKDSNGQSYPAYKLNVLPGPQSITAASPLYP